MGEDKGVFGSTADRDGELFFDGFFLLEKEIEELIPRFTRRASLFFDSEAEFFKWCLRAYLQKIRPKMDSEGNPIPCRSPKQTVQQIYRDRARTIEFICADTRLTVWGHPQMLWFDLHEDTQIGRRVRCFDDVFDELRQELDPAIKHHLINYSSLAHLALYEGLIRWLRSEYGHLLWPSEAPGQPFYYPASQAQTIRDFRARSKDREMRLSRDPEKERRYDIKRIGNERDTGRSSSEHS